MRKFDLISIGSEGFYGRLKYVYFSGKILLASIATAIVFPLIIRIFSMRNASIQNNLLLELVVFFIALVLVLLIEAWRFKVSLNKKITFHFSENREVIFQESNSLLIINKDQIEKVFIDRKGKGRHLTFSFKKEKDDNVIQIRGVYNDNREDLDYIREKCIEYFKEKCSFSYLL